MATRRPTRPWAPAPWARSYPWQGHRRPRPLAVRGHAGASKSCFVEIEEAGVLWIDEAVGGINVGIVVGVEVGIRIGKGVGRRRRCHRRVGCVLRRSERGVVVGAVVVVVVVVLGVVVVVLVLVLMLMLVVVVVMIFAVLADVLLSIVLLLCCPRLLGLRRTRYILVCQMLVCSRHPEVGGVEGWCCVV